MPEDVNCDEANVPEYELPELLRMQDGTAATPGHWPRRRAELVELLRAHVYGHPPALLIIAAIGDATTILDNETMTLRELTVDLCENTHAVRVLLALPKQPPRALFLGLNFRGNHTVHPAPGIAVTEAWVPGSKPQAPENRAAATGRGFSAPSWPLELITTRGFGLATAYAGEIDPDYDDGFLNGIHAYETEARGETSGGTIAAWAWGLSRLREALATLDELATTPVVALGHSRLGKTALWAAAQDENFAGAASNDSGCLGAALSRRRFGERLRHINTSFPHWFGARCKEYNEREDELPVDQHMLLACIAPRPLAVGNAAEDHWADPRGEFLACIAADPAWRLLGKAGLGSEDVPSINRPVGETLQYHIRLGGHGLTPLDWWHYCDFFARRLG